MNKVTALLVSMAFLSNAPLKAQDTAESLVEKTSAKIVKDGGVTMKLKVAVINGLETDTREVTFDMSGKSFRSADDENTIWFDGKTLWRGSDFGSGIEEIYISEPLSEDIAAMNIVELFRKHEGFSVEGNGRDTFTLTSDGSGNGLAGIRSITVKVEPATYTLSGATVLFADDIGDIRADITVLEYTAGHKFDDKTFVCPVKDFKDADIIDLR
ncbi:MAG: hypothetical protein J6T18_03390 [Bacteroidaceae bacterium]|nr:hypothetical protein [Bacteroidaceae bacterium]